jgi:hypothetical protein
MDVVTTTDIFASLAEEAAAIQAATTAAIDKASEVMRTLIADAAKREEELEKLLDEYEDICVKLELFNLPSRAERLAAVDEIKVRASDPARLAELDTHATRVMLRVRAALGCPDGANLTEYAAAVAKELNETRAALAKIREFAETVGQGSVT